MQGLAPEERPEAIKQLGREVKRADQDIRDLKRRIIILEEWKSVQKRRLERLRNDVVG
jgi:hypothetical protein